MHTKKSDQEYAAKLILLNITKLVHQVIAINRGDYIQKQLKTIIKENEPKSNNSILRIQKLESRRIKVFKETVKKLILLRNKINKKNGKTTN